MGRSNFTDEFKRDAVRQITERGYPVSEVSQRLGVSLHLVTGRRTRGVTRQAAFASLHELLGPGIIKALGNTLAPAQLGNTVLAAQAIEHNPDLVLCRKMPSGRPADILDNLFGGLLRLRGFRRHSGAFVLQMRPELSLTIKPNSVPRVLMPDRSEKAYRSTKGFCDQLKLPIKSATSPFSTHWPFGQAGRARQNFSNRLRDKSAKYEVNT